MATSTHYFSGSCKWAKVHKPDERYGKYSIDVQLSGKELEEFKSLGLKNGTKEDGYVTFRRDPMGKVWTNGVQGVAGAPRVIDPEGKPITDLVGNGSHVTVKVSVYDYNNKFGKGKGSRLEVVCVDKLEKYERETPAEVKVTLDVAPPSVPLRRLF